MATLMPVRPTKPINVAALRGVLWALIAGAVTVIVAATPVELEVFGWAAPILVFLARVLEAGILDRKQPPQAGRLGGQGPA